MPRSGFPSAKIGVHEKIRETEGFSTETARIILRNLVHLDQPFEPPPAVEDHSRGSPLVTRRENLLRSKSARPDCRIDCAVIYSEALVEAAYRGHVSDLSAH